MIAELRRLAEAWFSDASGCLPAFVESALDKIGFTQPYVEECIVSARVQTKSKVIKDNVWGMIEVDGPSIRLLDCPIVQRLRGIKQLGLSYLTYPSAEHSRFAHSLGMYAVIAKFLESAERASRRAAGASYKVHQPEPNTRADLLHAAIMHDVGHTPFSHASEFSLQTLPNLKVGGLLWRDFIDPAAEYGIVAKPKLAELLSVLFVLSPRFRRFYSCYVRHADDESTAEAAPFRMACLILGKPPNDREIGYAELISGRLIDADKLDYVNRDGLACGIPIGIDMGRLFLRSAFVDVSKDELNRLWKEAGIKQRATHDQIHFIVNSSGRDTIEEVISGKTSLYHRVYFHQTTRNAERLLEKTIHQAFLSSAAPEELDAINIWTMSDPEFLSKLRDSPNDKVRSLADRLVARRMLKRAMIFGSDDLDLIFPIRTVLPTLSSTDFENDLRYTILSEFEKGKGGHIKGDRLAALEKDIAEEALRLRRLVSPPPPHPVRDHGEIQGIPPLIAISPLQQSPEANDSCLVLQNDEIVLSGQLHNATQTNAAEDIFKAAGYVLAEDDWRDYAMFAARKVLAQRTAKIVDCQLRINQGAEGDDGSVKELVFAVKGYRVLQINQARVIRRSGLKREVIDRIELSAISAGYFDDFPFLSSMPALDFGSLEEKLSKFEGQFGWRISRDLIEAYVWQYPPRYRQTVFHLLGKINLLDRQRCAQKLAFALEAARRDRPSARKIRLCPLSPNSGNEIRVALEENTRATEDFARSFTSCHSIREALRDFGDDHRLFLIDDNVVSASQAFCQLAWWLKVPEEKWPEESVGEVNVDRAPLDSDEELILREAILSSRVSICVCVGSPSSAAKNLQALVAAMSDRSMEGREQDLFPTEVPEIRVYCADDLSAESPGDLEFDDFLGRVGRDCYAHSKFGSPYSALSRDKKRICDRNRLGFGNMRGLTITFRNVPVSTFTALWSPGIFEGRPWIPLAIRRGYVSKLVLG